MAGIRWLLPAPTTPSPETESVAARAKRDTERVRKSWFARGTVLLIDGAITVAVAEILASANKASLSIGVLSAVAFVGVGFAAVGVIYVSQLAVAPLRQRKEWRAQLPREREEARARSKNEREQARAEWQTERNAFDSQWQETERIRGLLGEAENRIRELEEEVARLRRQVGQSRAKPSGSRSRTCSQRLFVKHASGTQSLEATW